MKATFPAVLAFAALIAASGSGFAQEVLPGMGPDGPSIPFNVLGWQAERRYTRTRARSERVAFDPYAGCRWAKRQYDTGVGAVIYNYPVCDR